MLTFLQGPEGSESRSHENYGGEELSRQREGQARTSTLRPECAQEGEALTAEAGAAARLTGEVAH